MVIFSDFQCPFCKRVEPTLAQIEKEYGGKVRHGLEELPAPLPQQRRAGGRGGDGGGRAGEVLGDARQAVREQHRARPPQPGEVRAGAGPQHGQVQGRPRQQQVQERDRVGDQGRPGRRRQRHAGGVHQRPQDLGRLPVRDLQEDRRRGAGRRRPAATARRSPRSGRPRSGGRRRAERGACNVEDGGPTSAAPPSAVRRGRRTLETC